MADAKVSELTSATSAGGSDVLYLVQTNASKKISVANFFGNISNPTFTGNVVFGGSPQLLGAPGIININTPITQLSVDAIGGVLNIPQGANGQVKIITMTSAAGGTYTLNTSNIAGNVNVSLDSVGDTVVLFFTGGKWNPLTSSTAGGDNSNVGNVTITSDSLGNAYTWIFGADSNLILAGGGLLGQVYGDGINTELTLKSPPGVGDTGYVALSSANEKSYVEVNNIGIDLAVEFGTGNFKKWEFDNSGNLTAPGIISATNVNATTSFGLPVYATDAARDTAIPSPQTGMMVYVSGGEGAGLQVRGANNWNTVSQTSN